MAQKEKRFPNQYTTLATLGTLLAAGKQKQVFGY